MTNKVTLNALSRKHAQLQTQMVAVQNQMKLPAASNGEFNPRTRLKSVKTNLNAVETTIHLIEPTFETKASNQHLAMLLLNLNEVK